MAAPTAASVLQEIQASNLVDGQQIKQLLTDMLTLLDATNVTPQAGPAELTDSTAGTVSTTTLTAIPAAVASVGADTSAATVASVNASLAIIRNDIASLNALVNATLTKLVAAGAFTTV